MHDCWSTLRRALSSLFSTCRYSRCSVRCAVLVLAAAVPHLSFAQAPPPAQLHIAPNNIVTPVSPNLYGMMTEEINHAFDGGLYAEMVQNRTFRSSWQGVEHWDLLRRGNAEATMQIDNASGPSKALPASLHLTVTAASVQNEAGLSNTGYWGMGLKRNTLYRGSFYARLDDAAVGPIKVQLVSDDSSAVLAEATIPVHAGDWSRYAYTMTTGTLTPSSKNHLQLLVTHPGSVWLQEVSLMPPTFNTRPNGNRPDLMERMAALHPHFLRLPGGNYLEGDTLKDWYNWKQTIGPLVDRPGHQAPWSYWSSDGLGFLEFLQWCEDLHIEPVLAVYAGYSLQQQHVEPASDLEPYVQSALDEVEYVTGDASTEWGAERARDGHPAPFPLRYVEIGNEDNFDKSGSYDARFAQFARALRKRYPQLKLIATTPVQEKEPALQPDVLDDHYYKSFGEMLDFTHHYDHAPRTGPKIFVGEWATLSGTPTPNFGAALADAAWMTSLERNSDLIIMASYAPLFINVNPGAGQWYTNLIGYDAASSYASPSYYAQSLFAGHLGDGTAQSSITGAGDRFFYSATVGSKDHILHLKLVNASTTDQPLAIDLEGVSGTHTASVISLHAATYAATNSIAAPDVIHPVMASSSMDGEPWKHTVPALTIEVLDIALN